MNVAVAIVTCFIAVDVPHAQPADDPNLIRHIPGDGDVLIRRTDDIPPPLRDALKGAAGCRHTSALSELGIITFRPAPGFHPMTLVPCESIVLYSRVFLLDRGLASPPSVMKFPQLLLIWNAKSKELIGYRFTDLVTTPWYVYREIYRHLGGAELNGFVLDGRERGEFTKYGGKNWQPIEAQPPNPRR